MILAMIARVVFPETSTRKELSFKKVIEVSINSSWKELTSRAEILLSRNIPLFEKYKVKDIFHVGDPVVIYLGYNNSLFREYSGYIVSVSADIPIIIRCEDEMYKLKQLPVNYSNSSAELQTMLSTICSGYSVDALENVKLGGVRFSQTTVSKVLEKLQQDYNLFSYIKDGQLVCGKYYADDTNTEPVAFNLERNVVSNDLSYKTKEDIVLKVKGVSILSNGSKIEYEIGEDGGDNLSLTYYNISGKAELEKIVKSDYEKRKQDGFEGSITAYGIPRVIHGWKASLISFIYPDRNGVYYIDAVNKIFSDQGYRQQLILGGKV